MPRQLPQGPAGSEPRLWPDRQPALQRNVANIFGCARTANCVKAITGFSTTICNVWMEQQD